MSSSRPLRLAGLLLILLGVGGRWELDRRFAANNELLDRAKRDATEGRQQAEDKWAAEALDFAARKEEILRAWRSADEQWQLASDGGQQAAARSAERWACDRATPTDRAEKAHWEKLAEEAICQQYVCRSKFSNLEVDYADRELAYLRACRDILVREDLLATPLEQANIRDAKLLLPLWIGGPMIGLGLIGWDAWRRRGQRRGEIKA